MKSEYIVVSDLDGTLLDHYSYDWSEARQALALLKSLEIPLILCSSKTAAEMMPLRKSLMNSDAFIVENGAAIYLPDEKECEESADIISFGMNRAEVITVVNKARQEQGFCFTGFNDMTLRDLIAATGLDEESAACALQREFTEPLLWQDSEESKARFVRVMAKAGLQTVQGGRFIHVSAGCDKGKALQYLKKLYEKNDGHARQVIALGDSENDISMLECADLPVLVKSPVKPFPEIRHQDVYHTSATGPAGWNEALLKILT